MNYRSKYCGEVTSSDQGQDIVLSGWVDRIREVGGLTFVLLRDRSGIVQLAIDASSYPGLHESVAGLHHEDIIHIKGKVVLRSEKDINPKMPTGQIEVLVNHLQILSSCNHLPFNVLNSQDVDENLRMKHRYIDLRNPEVSKIFELRHRVMQLTRQHFTKEGFWEVETPYLAKSTPEGARDFLVPSRVNPAHFYALTQSPQIYKQLLMMGGIEKYFQICRCFRDEDFRLDRQPEFSQIDFEAAFTTNDELKRLIEALMKTILASTHQIDLNIPFMELSYQEAMERYGCDKPDLRNPLLIHSIEKHFLQPEYVPFYERIQQGEAFLAIPLSGEKLTLSRKQSDELLALFKTEKVALYLFKHKEEGISISILKEEDRLQLENALDTKAGDLIIAALGPKKIITPLMAKIRQHIGLPLLSDDEKNSFKFAWIVDFPLFEWNEDDQRYQSAHHLFTLPRMEDYMQWKTTQVEDIRSESFDLVLNGFELGSGGLRIYDPVLQKEILRFMGLSDELIQEQFGFLLDAMSYGAPPEGGFAIGLDRLIMILAGKSSLRDVIAFPKNTRGASALTGEPSQVRDQQLSDLHIELKKEKA